MLKKTKRKKIITKATKQKNRSEQQQKTKQEKKKQKKALHNTRVYNNEQNSVSYIEILLPLMRVFCDRLLQPNENGKALEVTHRLPNLE